MNRIKLSEYNPGMGILIDVQHPEDYMKNPTLGSVNIYADKLLFNSKNYLDFLLRAASDFFLRLTLGFS